MPGKNLPAVSLKSGENIAVKTARPGISDQVLKRDHTANPFGNRFLPSPCRSASRTAAPSFPLKPMPGPVPSAPHRQERLFDPRKPWRQHGFFLGSHRKYPLSAAPVRRRAALRRRQQAPAVRRPFQRRRPGRRPPLSSPCRPFQASSPSPPCCGWLLSLWSSALPPAFRSRPSLPDKSLPEKGCPQGSRHHDSRLCFRQGTSGEQRINSPFENRKTARVLHTRAVLSYDGAGKACGPAFRPL